ncbi:MAG: TetR/AcrR family transcriptional regulator [Pseudomonadota bacterium]
MSSGPPIRRRRKDERPDEIVEAGFQAFAESGFHGTTLDDVAKRAGITKGTIYLYFDSKQALFEAAVQSRSGPLLGEVEGLVNGWDSSMEALLRLMIQTMHAAINSGELKHVFRIMIAEGERFPELTKFHYENFVSKFDAILEQVLSRGIATGEFRDTPVNRTPMLVMSPGLMTLIWRMTFHPYKNISPREFLDGHLDLVLNGLRAGGQDA